MYEIAAICAREKMEGLDALTLEMLCRHGRHGHDCQAAFDAPNGFASVAHTRLSIVDLLSYGDQPMANETEDVWIVCSGEIYNHVELRQTLEEKSRRLRSHPEHEDSK